MSARPVAVYFPYNVTILGIDTATNSGWAVRRRGQLIASGEVNIKRPEMVTKVPLLAAKIAAASGTPILVVMERPFGGSVTVVMALGAARQAWRTACVQAGISERRIAEAQPNTWRSGLFGRRWVRAPRDEIRAHELRYACAETRMSADDIGDDEAAAICISAWAARARALGEKYNLKQVDNR